jgi:hypothetical protein
MPCALLIGAELPDVMLGGRWKESQRRANVVGSQRENARNVGSVRPLGTRFTVLSQIAKVYAALQLTISFNYYVLLRLPRPHLNHRPVGPEPDWREIQNLADVAHTSRAIRKSCLASCTEYPHGIVVFIFPGDRGCVLPARSLRTILWLLLSGSQPVKVLNVKTEDSAIFPQESAERAFEK